MSTVIAVIGEENLFHLLEATELDEPLQHYSKAQNTKTFISLRPFAANVAKMQSVLHVLIEIKRNS